LARSSAPPAILYALAWGSLDLRHGQGLPGVHGFHSGDGWRLLRLILDGEQLRATKELVRAEPMQGRFAGQKTFIQEEEIRYYNQADELIAIQSFPIIRAERGRRSRVARTARRSRPPIPTNVTVPSPSRERFRHKL
jgi:hypothetical protein